jgi:hypothetical protein
MSDSQLVGNVGIGINALAFFIGFIWGGNQKDSSVPSVGRSTDWFLVMYLILSIILLLCYLLRGKYMPINNESDKKKYEIFDYVYFGVTIVLVILMIVRIFTRKDKNPKNKYNQ